MSSGAIETTYRPAVERAQTATAQSAESLAERVAPWVARVACVWFALAAAWGLFGPIPAGHYGTMGGEGIIGENMVRWHILGPVWSYMNTRPTPADYYCHHPWGGFWIMGALYAIFGHHNFVLPLPAVLMSAATPPLLYGIGRQVWNKVAGAAAAVGFVFLPITLGFANFHNVEATVLFACTLFFWGHARMVATWKRRYLVASLCGAALAACADWPAYVMLATLLGVTLLRAFLLPRSWTPPLRFRMYATWWAWAVTLSVGFLVLHIALFARSDKLLDWLGSATSRGLGAPTTLAQALEGRKHWIELSFTPLVIFLGKLAAPLAVLRLLWRRNEAEAYSLSILTGATASYVFFKQAADIHIFWSQYFGGYFALALAQLVTTLQELIRFFGGARARRHVHRVLAMVPIALTSAFGLIMFPDGCRALRYARETGGRFNENGAALNTETNIIYVLDLLKKNYEPIDGPDLVNPGLQWSWAYLWQMHGAGRSLSSLPMEHAAPQDPHHTFLARASSLSVEQLRALVATFHVKIYGDDVWVVDRREPAAPLDAYALEEREPWPWEWYFISGVEPMRKYVPDPYSTWEWRTTFDQPPPAVDVPPKSFEQIRIAYNMAIAADDKNRARELRARIEEGMTRIPGANFTQGLTLLGYRRIGGTEPRIVNIFEATGTAARTDAMFAISAQVERSKPFSLIPPDPIVRAVSLTPALSTKLYRPGFIYANTVVLRQRIGIERFWGVFQSKDGAPPPTRVDGQAETPLLVAK